MSYGLVRRNTTYSAFWLIILLVSCNTSTSCRVERIKEKCYTFYLLYHAKGICIHLISVKLIFILFCSKKGHTVILEGLFTERKKLPNVKWYCGWVRHCTQFCTRSPFICFLGLHPKLGFEAAPMAMINLEQLTAIDSNVTPYGKNKEGSAHDLISIYIHPPTYIQTLEFLKSESCIIGQHRINIKTSTT